MRAIESLVTRAVMCLALAACATGTAAGPSASVREQLASARRTTSRLSYIIEGSSLPAERALVDVVRERWPQLVTGDLPRGNAGQAESRDRFGVYDARGVFLGGPDYLQGLRAADVREIRRLTAMEEFALIGKRHPAGAVLLTWRKVL